MNNKVLAIIFGILLAIFLISRFACNQSAQSFKEVLISLDTSKIDKVILFPKNNEPSFELNRMNGEWKLRQEERELPALSSSVNSFLSQLKDVRTKRIVARSEDKWEEFEVDELKGFRIEVFGNNKKLDDFVVGRFYFNQQNRTALTYFRKSNEDDIYAVDGFLSMSLSQGFDAYRDKTLVSLNKDDIQSIQILSAEQRKLYSKDENGLWIDDNANNLDSSSMASYLNKLSSLRGSEFFEDEVDNLKEFTKLLISANNQISDIEVNCYKHPDDGARFVFHSNRNTDNYFESDSSGTFKALFLDLPTLTEL